MSPRGIAIIGFFALASLASLAQPFWGLAAYVTHYHSYPEKSWWGAGLAGLGIRYSFMITAFLTMGTLLNLKKLPYGRFVRSQELLYLIFLSWVIIGRFVHGQETQEDVVDKLLKMAVFLFALTHILVEPRRFTQFLWVLVLCGIYLGFECYSAPRSRYVKGRLEGIGGPDFSDSNALAAHLVAVVMIVGIRFLRTNWKGKLVCFISGGFLANGIVQTRSRGGYLASIVAIGVMLLFAPRGQRKKIVLLIILGAAAASTLVDAAYFERMATMQAGEREKDESAMGRLRFWKAGLQMAADHPFGVGPGNFFTHIGDYLPQDAGRDTHNTYIRCVTELGWPGLALLGLLILNAYRTLFRIRRHATGDPGSQECAWNAYSLQMSLSGYLTSAIFISAIYVEMLWWLLLLPTALERASSNAGRCAAE